MTRRPGIVVKAALTAVYAGIAYWAISSNAASSSWNALLAWWPYSNRALQVSHLRDDLAGR